MLAGDQGVVSVSQHLDRSLLIDGLKALAAQIIVIHHLVSYGPMAASATQAAPDLAAWFLYYGRWAVQVFLVIAGFLTAQALCRKPSALDRPWSLVTKRYIRLVWPFGLAVTLAVLAAELARFWTNDPILPAPVGVVQYAAHWLLVHSILGHESLSTGVWYVAIDFQLFLLTVLLLWTSQALRWQGWAPLFIGLLTVASLVWIRTWQDWDNWAPYFYNAYGVGLLIGWLGLREAANLNWIRWILIAVIGVLCWQLVSTHNGRLTVILLTAGLLWLAGHPVGRSVGTLPFWEGRVGSAIHYLGSTSFALFLLHFPVSMLVNAAQDRFDWTSPVAGLYAMLAAWVISMVIADVFYRVVERQGLMLSRRIR
ncbi:MAG: acyltransferase [Rhodocyclaceae bacterium]|jgi:peptidoglycan/LPS O-acetylase OafA/YrhL|nr:acyltransferase [Rhodocyclaceae bacterium]